MNYLNVENYQALNEKLSQAYSDRHGFALKVRAFENIMFAGYDLCFGLLQFLSHKPKVGIIRSGTSLQEYLLPHFYRLQTPVIFKKDTENIPQYILQFDHEVNFVTWSSENEITGEVLLNLEQRQEIHKGLSAKRIFSIEIKAKFTSEDAELLKQNAYGVIVEAGTLFSKEQCLIFHSEKLKTPSLVGHYQNNLKTQAEYLKAEAGIANTALLKKADELQLNFFNRYASKPATLQDRLVIYSKTVAGTALKDMLKLDSSQAFAPSELPSWVTDSVQAWWPEAKSSDLMMGLLVINLQAISENSLQQINELHDKLTSQSTWAIT
jgi:hypothetical protein